MTYDDDRMLEDIVCGDLGEQDPAVRARLAANPRLLLRLADLRAAQQEVTAFGDDAGMLADEAEALVAPGDRERVAGALRPPTRRKVGWRLLALAAAAAAALVFALSYGNDDRTTFDGRLGGADGISVQREGDRWSLLVEDALPPGTSYHLLLEFADGTTATASAESRAWQFPDSWNEAILRATAAKLVVEWDDGTGLFVRRVLQLR